MTFAGCQIDLPEGWLDITDDLPEESPFTLALADGVGAIQLSLAMYGSGVRPQIDEAALLGMLNARVDGVGGSSTPTTEQSDAGLVIVGSEGITAGDVVGIWYLSDGTNIALITYVGGRDEAATATELADARSIVRSFSFAAIF